MTPFRSAPRPRFLPISLGFCIAAMLAPGPASAAAPSPAPVTAAKAATLSPAGEGRRTYLKYNCYGCHGMGAAGGMGPNIIHAEQGDLNEVIQQGGEGGMPSFKAYLNSTDVNNLSAYLNSIGSKSEPKFKDWWVDVPPK